MIDSDLLNFAVKNDMLDLNTIQVLYTENYLMEKHKEKIWQGKNGRWYTYVPDPTSKSKRRLIAKSAREDLEKAVIESYKKGPSVEEVFYEWAGKKLEYGEIYKQTYDRYVNDYKRYLKDSIGQMEISRIKPLWLEDFIKNTIKERNLSAKQWANMRLVINGIFKLSKKKGLTDFSISQFMQDIDIGKKAFRAKTRVDESQVFTDEEAQKVISWIDSHPKRKEYEGIKLVFMTGLRAGELSALKQIDVDGYVIHVRRTEVRYKDDTGHYVRDFRESTKGKVGYRDVVLTEEAKNVLDDIVAMSNGAEFLFEGYTGLNFTQALERICESVHIPPRSMHKIRKMYCTVLLNAGVPENVIKAQVGHVDISTTKQFYYFNNLSVKDRKNMLENTSLIIQ